MIILKAIAFLILFVIAVIVLIIIVFLISSAKGYGWMTGIDYFLTNKTDKDDKKKE